MRSLIIAILCFSFCCCSAFAESYGTWSWGREKVRSLSAYTAIESDQGVLRINLQYRGIIPAQADHTMLQYNITRAINAWTGALQGNPYWKYETVDVTFGGGNYSVIVDTAIQRSYAIPELREIHLSPSYLASWDPNSFRVILHEFGHMMGLADTYSEGGYQTPINQPSGIMNYAYLYDELQPDDIAGAIAVYEYANGRGPFCRGIYVPGGAYENKNQIAFCAPR